MFTRIASLIVGTSLLAIGGCSNSSVATANGVSASNVPAASTGAVTSNVPALSKQYAVTATSTSFFKYGPQQGNGADQHLPKDTLMTVLRPSFGYFKVRLTTGEEGYVATEDVGVAPPTLIAAAQMPAQPEAVPQHSRPVGEQFRLDSNDPRLVPPPEDLPAPGSLEPPTP
jgi:hypothetical protein